MPKHTPAEAKKNRLARQAKTKAMAKAKARPRKRKSR